MDRQVMWVVTKIIRDFYSVAKIEYTCNKFRIPFPVLFLEIEIRLLFLGNCVERLRRLYLKCLAPQKLRAYSLKRIKMKPSVVKIRF